MMMTRSTHDRGFVQSHRAPRVDAGVDRAQVDGDVGLGGEQAHDTQANKFSSDRLTIRNALYLLRKVRSVVLGQGWPATDWASG